MTLFYSSLFVLILFSLIDYQGSTDEIVVLGREQDHYRMIGPVQTIQAKDNPSHDIDVGSPAPPPQHTIQDEFQPPVPKPDVTSPLTSDQIDALFKEDKPKGDIKPIDTVTADDIILLQPPKPETEDIPEGHLTSEQIDALLVETDAVNSEITKTKTIDQIILESTKDQNSTTVREGDVAISGTEEFEVISRQKRQASEEASEDYDYEGDEAPEAPGLSINEIEAIPPPDGLTGRGRSPGDKSIDEIFGDAGFNGEMQQATSVLKGRASTRFRADKIVDMDMLMTEDQFNNLFEKSGRKKRAGLRRSSNYWPQSVLPYQFMNGVFSDRDKTEIYKAMKDWQKKTCIRFEPYTEQLARRLGHKNRIIFQNGGGCSSYVGVIRRGPQPVTLAPGCRWQRIITHELGHAIGLHHEQCRPDRDDYLTLYLQNVQAGMRYNFDKYKTDYVNSHNIPYDYLSIMHYGKLAFSNNNQITIYPKDRSYLDRIGKTEELTASDARLVNIMYKCNVNPTTPPTTTKAPIITECKDKSRHCKYWQSRGECQRNPAYMARYCTKACGLCTIGKCEDENKYCPQWQKMNFCDHRTYKSFMTKRCAKSCGKCGSAYADLAHLWGENAFKDAGLTTKYSPWVISFLVAAVSLANVF